MIFLLIRQAPLGGFRTLKKKLSDFCNLKNANAYKVIIALKIKFSTKQKHDEGNERYFLQCDDSGVCFP